VAAILYAPVADATLADQADLILEFDVLDSYVADNGGTFAIETNYTLLVTRVFKGAQDSTTLEIRVPGTNGEGLVVPGAPQLAAGDRGLGFLIRRADGLFAPLHLGLGLFTRLEAEGAILAIPGVPRDALSSEQATTDGVRDYEGFADWLADRARGIIREESYWLAEDVLEEGGLSRVSQDFTLLRFQGRDARWFEFDGRVSVDWRFNPSGSFGSSPAFQQALAIWNRERKTNISYSYAGETASQDFSRGTDSRAEGLVLFDDPFNLAAGSVTCSGNGRPTGVLAVGGYFPVDAATGGFLTPSTSQLEVRIYRGREVLVIGAGFVVVNDGMECFLRRAPLANLVELFGHELGHTLGIGHSCGDVPRCPRAAQNVALMRAFAHLDGRHNRLYLDDINAAKSLYSSAAGGGGGNSGGLLAPSNLTGQALGGGEVLLTWSDNSSNEASFLVQIKVNQTAWRFLGTAPPDSTSGLVTGLSPGPVYKFRVRAQNGGTRSGWSNVAVVRNVR
jgi:hypothetical protein